MTTFQLDECINSRRFADDCRNQGRVDIRRYPRGQRGQQDPEVLQAHMAGANPLLTTDRSMLEDHLEHIPEAHPGIVVIANSPSVLHTLRESDVRRILARCKIAFPRWHEVSWRNSLVELTQDDVSVSHIERGLAQTDLTNVRLSEPDFGPRLEAVLAANAARFD